MNRITTLLGAGAVLDCNRSDGILTPTTKNITNAILEVEQPTFENDGKICLLKTINDEALKVLRNIGNEYIIRQNKNASLLNFEDILHLAEMCMTYGSCYQDTYFYPHAYPLSGTILDCKDFIKQYKTIEFYRAVTNGLTKIADIINAYDEDFDKQQETNKWFINFWQQTKGWDIFTLNYDSLVEQCLIDYEDGYEESVLPNIQHFMPSKYLENHFDLPTIAHLHGSILFSEYSSKEYHYTHGYNDLYKHSSYKLAQKYIDKAFSESNTQSRERFVSGHIITGLHKTDKITFAPYNFYHANFANKISTNNALLIVGYSFGDLYINQLLRNIILIHGNKTRVVFIECMPKYIKSYLDFTHYILHTNVNGYRNKFISGIVEQERLMFLPDIMGDKEPVMDFTAWNKPIMSKNGRLMMFICGFKEAITHHNDTIMTFLHS